MPEMHLRLAHNPTRVVVEREPDVPDTFWLRVWGEWGSDGRHPNVAVSVPLAQFLSNKDWVRSACKTFSVRPVVDAELTRLLTIDNSIGSELSQSRAARHLSPEEVKARLAGSRFKRALRPFQIRDLGRLLALAHGANFSVPGAGKTAVTSALYEAERHAGRVERLLVVAPLSAFSAWQEEAEACFSVPPIIRRFDSGDIEGAEIVLANYHQLANSYAVLAEWVSEAPTMVVLDEAHRMKRGWSGQQGAACLNIAYLASRRDILTGTPAPQSPGDLEALTDYLWPRQARLLLPADALRARPSQDAVAATARAIAPLFTRTTKAELELPPMSITPVTVALTGLQRSIYDALRNQLSSELFASKDERIDVARMGRVLMYLLEAATNPDLLPVGGKDADQFRHPPLPIPEGSSLRTLLAAYPHHETPPKFIKLTQMVRSNAEQGRKTLVWSNFIRNIEFLERQLAIYKPAVVHGGVPSREEMVPGVRTREAELYRFRNDDECMVLIANPAALGEGVSLHGVCHDAIYLDRTFNAGHYLQSLDRLHRLGLLPDQDTRVTFLLTEDTIDEVVDARIRAKAERLAELLDDPAVALMALPDEEDYGDPVDVGDSGDIAALFAHLRGEHVE
jgi:SNF2 family DNA or RNA helicase